MKKVNVIVAKEFLDLETGLTMKVGKTMTVTDSRFLELHRKGFVKYAKADAKPVEKATDTIKK
jgi:hypothetical protein